MNHFFFYCFFSRETGENVCDDIFASKNETRLRTWAAEVRLWVGAGTTFVFFFLFYLIFSFGKKEKKKNVPQKTKENSLPKIFLVICVSPCLLCTRPEYSKCNGVESFYGTARRACSVISFSISILPQKTSVHQKRMRFLHITNRITTIQQHTANLIDMPSACLMAKM